MDTPAGEYKYKYNQKNKDKKNFLESSTKLVHHASHMGHKDKYTQRSATPKRGETINIFDMQ